jgi:hypothetical protein
VSSEGCTLLAKYSATMACTFAVSSSSDCAFFLEDSAADNLLRESDIFATIWEIL